MPEALILDATRSPWGKFGGALKEYSAAELASYLIRTIIERNHLAPEDVENVLLGQVLQAGAGQLPSRQALIGAGLPGQHPHRRRLARAVRPEQPEAGPGRHLQVEAVHRRHRAEPLDHASQGDRARLRCRHGPSIGRAGGRLALYIRLIRRRTSRTVSAAAGRCSASSATIASNNRLQYRLISVSFSGSLTTTRTSRSAASNRPHR